MLPVSGSVALRVPTTVSSSEFSSMVVFDTVYNPENTLLIKDARSQSCTVVTGVGVGRSVVVACAHGASGDGSRVCPVCLVADRCDGIAVVPARFRIPRERRLRLSGTIPWIGARGSPGG